MIILSPAMIILSPAMIILSPAMIILSPSSPDNTQSCNDNTQPCNDNTQSCNDNTQSCNDTPSPGMTMISPRSMRQLRVSQLSINAVFGPSNLKRIPEGGYDVIPNNRRVPFHLPIERSHY